MRVLLIHPDDHLPAENGAVRWDLIVDFGRAPGVTYERWSRQAACPVISLYDFVEEVEDLHRCRELLRPGMGCLVDRYGIDWWDILSLGVVPDLHQLVLLERLGKYIGSRCELHSTRRFPLTTILGYLLNCDLMTLESHWQSVRRPFRRYSEVLMQLNRAQITQAMQDKFDPHHSIRRRFSRQGKTLRGPLVLLPSAYVNVSRTAVGWAELVPEQKFLLVCARKNGRLQSLPPNVFTVSLDAYFGSSSKGEDCLLDRWQALRHKLIREMKEFEAAERAGMLERIASGLRWGVNVRDAWSRVFEAEDITGCLCADDTNPYTRIPLVLAKNRGIVTLACHHGTLDSWMALKTVQADFYLTRSEMERDYLIQKCHVAREKVVAGSLAGAPAPVRTVTPRTKGRWLVFFTEPYQNSGWRSHEVYRDLLPRLCSLSETCGLKLVFKLHPFESVRGHRRMLRRIMGHRVREIDVIDGPPSDELWQNTRVALTVQSSTALECAGKGMPVFLCAWLRDAYAGYVQQYAKFGVGRVLESPEQIANIPQLLDAPIDNRTRTHNGKGIDPETLRALFSARYSLPVAIHA